MVRFDGTNVACIIFCFDLLFRRQRMGRKTTNGLPVDYTASRNLEASKCYIVQPLNEVAVTGKSSGVQVNN
jgi:hypothetical protein